MDAYKALVTGLHHLAILENSRGSVIRRGMQMVFREQGVELIVKIPRPSAPGASDLNWNLLMAAFDGINHLIVSILGHKIFAFTGRIVNQQNSLQAYIQMTKAQGGSVETVTEV